MAVTHQVYRTFWLNEIMHLYICLLLLFLNLFMMIETKTPIEHNRQSELWTGNRQPAADSF